jgi:predicted CoA-substrate-specific enzyme activase
VGSAGSAGGATIYFAGVDLGSTVTKAVIIDESGKICASAQRHTGAEHRTLAGRVMAEALKGCGITLAQVDYVVATGYGRINVPFADRQITELSCHARGVAQQFPAVRIAIDIGGQDSKVLSIKDGKLLDFAMNDKCAAGTGRFLEVLAGAAGLKVEELGAISARARGKVPVNSPCTVFIRQEVAEHLSQSVPVEEIVAGLHEAIAGRVAQMARRFKIEPEVVFTGGVAQNSGVVKALEANLSCRIEVPPEPLLSGAFGAALLAREYALKALAAGEKIQRGARSFGEE